MGDESRGHHRPGQRRARTSSSSSPTASRRWTPWRSTWRCCRSIRSGTARTAIRRPRSSSCRTRSSPSSCAAQPDRFAAFASLALQYPGPRGAAARGRGEEARPARRRDRRQRRRRGLLQSEISPGVGEGGRARRRAVHSSAEHAGARQALQGQRLARQHHRQSARHHDRAPAPHLRRHARPLPRPEGAARPMAAAISAPTRRAATTPASSHRPDSAIPRSS